MAFIEIIGIMGSGKTSLAKMFNEKAGFNALIEKEDDLKRLFFFREYIGDMHKHGFEGSLNMLAFHLNRTLEALSKHPEGSTSVTDAGLLVQYAYAKPYNTPENAELLTAVIREAYKKMPPVDLRIVITLPSDLHAQRIKNRGRDWEQGVKPKDLEEMTALITEAIEKLGGNVPTLYLDASKLDWVNSEKDKKAIIGMVNKKLAAPKR